MNPKDWVVEQLSQEHECGGFDCGEVSLNDFLQRHALENAQRGFGRTYVAVAPDDIRVIGYYTLSSGSVARDSLPKKHGRGTPYPAIPALHLGRLGVDSQMQRRGLGGYLLMHALALCERIASEVGVRLVDVTALHEEARDFYLRYGFTPVEDNKLHLFLPMKLVEKLGLNKPDSR